MKTDIDMFLLNIEQFLRDIRGSRYLHLEKVYFFVGRPFSFIHAEYFSINPWVGGSV